MESGVMVFFPVANEHDPVKKSVLARPICISDSVDSAHGKEWGTELSFQTQGHNFPVGTGQRLQ